MTRVLVCGGRDYDDRDHIWNTLTAIPAVTCIIHGCATGADSEAMIVAEALGIKHAPFRAEWQKYGKAAGPIRNQRMITEGKPDLVVAFPGGRGTADMVRRSRVAGIPVQIIKERRREG
jgi:hypothetical protein